MSAAVARLQEELQEVVPRAIAREPAKVVALRTGYSPRHVQNMLTGQVTWRPVANFLTLAMEYPELREWVAKLPNMDLNHDPRAVALVREIEKFMETRT